MDRSEKNSKRRQFRREEKAVLDILNEWEPIGFKTPEDEYDCLAHQVLSLLHTGAGQRELRDRIRTEIHSHFGLTDIPEDQIIDTAARIWGWWNSRND